MSDQEFKEVVSVFLNGQIMSCQDDRIFYAGIPTAPRKAKPTQYDFPMYKRLLKTLKDFGMQQLNARPYKNANSGNGIIMLVGRKYQP